MDEWRSQFPLRANGCRLVNQRGQHFKLAGVNWYGASDSYHVVGGLDVRPLAELCRSIAAMGFTVVRLPFSSEMLRIDGVPEGAIDYNINKDLEGLSPLQVYDRVIDELGAAGVTVVINNHTTVGAWSGGVELNGMWFRNQCEIYTEQSWIDDWVMMAKRYEHQPQVIGYDIRNEVRPTSMMGPSPRWGKTDATYDWSRAAGSCARALMDAAAPGLLVIERIAWPQNSLREMLSPKPPWEAWNVPRDRIVLSVHMYAWSGPGAWSPKHFMPGLLRSVFDVVDYVGARALYGEMGQAALETQMDQDFGFCIDEDLCPVWLSELGCSLDSELEWFGKVCKYLERKDVDFAYWPLNVGPKPGSGADDEAYGILTNDWQPRWADPRLQALRRLCPEPLIPSPRKVRRPLQLPRSRADSAGTPSPFHVITPSPDTAAVATPSCYGQVDEPLWRAPFPWCQPLPGPLVPWPGEPWSKEMPEARYIWEVLDGIDSDPGKDALTVRCDDLEAVKELCCRQRCGGFALHKGIAYFRLASPE
ncbi:4-beta-glucanase), partial [Durusdinium trenchii]